MKRLIILAVALLASSTIASAQEGAQKSVAAESQTLEKALSMPLTKKEQQKSLIYRYGERNWFGTVQASIMIFSPQEVAGGAKFIAGYSFNPWISVGGGFGVHYMDWSDISDSVYIPVNAHFRVNFLDRRVTPYFVADAGAMFYIGKFAGVEKLDTDIKPYLHPELGIGIRFNKGQMLNIGAGFAYFFPAYCATVNIGFTL